MGELSFAKLDKLATLPMGKVFIKPNSKDMFRVIGPNNEVERFTGNFLERAEVRKRWATTYITQSRFAELVEWPTLECAPNLPSPPLTGCA